MSIYAIVRVSNPELMGTLLEEAFPGDYLQLQDDEWLVSSTGSAREVSDRLETAMLENDFGSAMVLRVGSYWGRATVDIWDWMQEKLGKSNG